MSDREYRSLARRARSRARFGSVVGVTSHTVLGWEYAKVVTLLEHACESAPRHGFGAFVRKWCTPT